MSTTTTTSSPVNSAIACTLTNNFGITVQAVLSVLVLVVLCLEYLHERCSNFKSKKYRTLLQFWFDTYKICAGALVSHAFNTGVSLIVGGKASGANECAVYALTFFYEATGVPFVQLLQYGLVNYAIVMSQEDRKTDACRHRWKAISEPGVYFTHGDREYEDRGRMSCCWNLELFSRKGIVTLLFSAAFAVGTTVLAKFVLKQQYPVAGALGFLGAIFAGTVVVAPMESHWQVVGWMTIKISEKATWSFMAIMQGKWFRDWSRNMSTHNAHLDAWLFIAVIPIIMNAFMFFMFSRISRLRIPCLTIKHREELDQREELFGSVGLDSYDDSTLSPPLGSKTFDLSEAFRVGFVYTLIINTVLYSIAIAYLESNGARGVAAVVLLVSILVLPAAIGVVGIFIFQFLVNNQFDLLCCCCGRPAALCAIQLGPISSISHSPMSEPLRPQSV